jgi:GT2 family glycosyltransferase
MPDALAPTAAKASPEGTAAPPAGRPLVSIIVLNYNGARWLERCLGSLRQQTIFERMEVLVADNASPDGSDRLAADYMRGWPNGRVIQHGENLGYCEGNNRAALQAKGEWFLFLNNDTWTEPDCLETLLSQVQAAGAQFACPQVLDYDSNQFQTMGFRGFDLFALPSTREPLPALTEVFMPDGCAYLMHRDAFARLGGFDPLLFMYVDEYDLSWRAWAAGYKGVAVPAARLHHRGAAQVNPAGGGTAVEFRTSALKRYYANRNSLLALLKNAQHLLLLLLPFQLALLAAEALASAVLIRRWEFVRNAYLEAVRDVWRHRAHVRTWRRRVGSLRQRSDLWMLRFLRLRFNRWDELLRMRRMGVPKV